LPAVIMQRNRRHQKGLFSKPPSSSLMSPTPAIRDFLNKVPEPSLKGINVAAFDTRIPTKLVRVFGYAAGRIAGNLKGKGGTLVASPEGFFVKGTKGPLREGELERAADWAKGILESKK